MTRDEAQKAMEATLSSLTSDNRWEAYLSVMAKFHRYSVNNSLLIFNQRSKSRCRHQIGPGGKPCLPFHPINLVGPEDRLPLTLPSGFRRL